MSILSLFTMKDKSTHHQTYVFDRGDRTLILTTMGLTFSLLAWMSFAQISQVVRVNGQVIPAGKSQLVQHLEGGIISGIRVQEGQRVHKGDIILEIDNTMANANYSEVRARLDGLMLKSQRLKAQLEGNDTPIFSGAISNPNIAEAEKALFLSRKDKQRQEVVASQSVLAKRVAELNDARSRKSKLELELSTLLEKQEIIESMAKNGAASKLEVLDAKSRVQNLRTQLSDVAGLIPQLSAAITEAKSKIDEIKSSYAADAQNEYVETLNEIEKTKQLQNAAKDRKSRTEISSPVDGIINSLTVNTIGGVVKPGDVLVEITPITDHIVIEARALPKDRGFLKPNLEAQIRLPSYDPAQFGTITGVVSKIGADTLKDNNYNAYYQVNIDVNELPPSYKDKEIIPGMIAIADIVTGQRSILNYLLSPLHKFTYNMFKDPK